jgi:hypothetical protein
VVEVEASPVVQELLAAGWSQTATGWSNSCSLDYREADGKAVYL